MGSLHDVAATSAVGASAVSATATGDSGEIQEIQEIIDASNAPDTLDAASAPSMPSATSPDIPGQQDNPNDTPLDIPTTGISHDDEPEVELQSESITNDTTKASPGPVSDVPASPPASTALASVPQSLPAPAPAPSSASEPPSTSWGEVSQTEAHVEAQALVAAQVQPTTREEEEQNSHPSTSPFALPASLDANSVVGSDSKPEPISGSQSNGDVTLSPKQLRETTAAAIASLQESLLPGHPSPEQAPQPASQPYDQQAEQQQAEKFQEQHRQQQLQEESNSHQEDQVSQYNGLSPAPLPATTVAQHGLQALQATPSVTSPASDHLAQQYAQSATLQMAAHQYAQAVNNVIGNGNHQSAQALHVHPSAHTVHHNLGHGHPPGPQHPSNPILPMPHGPPNGVSNTQKVTRLRRACDMCSQRKVKCDESGPPCKPCADLGVECTFDRRMKRRGPPNKHAEAARAAKKIREDESVTPVNAPTNGPSLSLSPQSSQQNAHSALDAEAIAPWPVLELLVDDFFTYIHPLMPFPHEPTFRQALAARADRTSTRFLALLSSMIGVLVASFPRSVRSHLKAQHSADLFPTSVTMIERCRDIALQARGALFMANDEMTAEDAATSYFLGLSAAYILRWKPCKRFLAETMTFVREVSVHRRGNSSSLGTDNGEPTSVFDTHGNKPVDHIKDQMTKRIFWVIMAGVRSMTQLGASINELPLPPPTSQEQYPEQPLEVDDEYIFSDQILPQPEGVPSLMAGFNRNICVYTTMNELVGVDMCYGMKFFDWNAQKNILGNGLASAKQATEDLPPHLQVKTEPGQPEPPSFDPTGLQYHPPAFPQAQPPDDVRHAFAEQPMRRRQLQFEIQKANIYASSLATRSYFVERYLNLRDAERQRRRAEGSEAGGDEDTQDERDRMVADERELIVRNLLTVLQSISQHNMEPNGGSIINKIRQVASTLMNDAPERKGPVAIKVEEYLIRFIEILMNLEKTGGRHAALGPMTAQDEEDELRCWASLRDYQLEFAANGGYLRQL